MSTLSCSLCALGNRVTIAAAAVTIAVTGASVEVDSTAAPSPSARSAMYPADTAPPTEAPGVNTLSTSSSSVDPAGFAEWGATSWTPATLQRVYAPDSTASAPRPGTPEEAAAQKKADEAAAQKKADEAAAQKKADEAAAQKKADKAGAQKKADKATGRKKAKKGR
jgi:hypothetical protein